MAVLMVSSACLPAQAGCPALAVSVNRDQDVSTAFQDCLKTLAFGGSLELSPGRYLLEKPIRIERGVAIRTRGIAAGAPGCLPGDDRRCAVLVLAPREGSIEPTQMPLEITADGVSMDHLVIVGVKGSKAFCRSTRPKAAGGGVRVSGSGFSFTRSAIRDIACYSALEITASASAPRLSGNRFGPNGTHRRSEDWSDGVTIHDSRGAMVGNNLFVDNTDVQLILGGCRYCRIVGNRFRTSGEEARSAFAALMLQSWPNTSGNYSGTVVERNDIDCGARKGCGYGLMIGAAPWYAGRASGGTVRGNSVRNAMIGINVDGVTGPMAFQGNRVERSGGEFASRCGLRKWPAANVAPGARRFVDAMQVGAETGAVSTVGCLLNRPRN
ncbi:right-handed parallel beta-helix repeat-containing protein [Sphingomonas ginkgonis]|uniref:Right-handed parallel beta-helix repeat-containing protein n=1 Tax=Sphingomonas ginkgonis TaxID=2315330 RepID=A0A429V8X4_9SPHN|nr:right-handed parallel beta-helix repeat-containing protein [Sphingomonas ginkgonis]RST30388.1 right-handed parallel beta-helix repeat-containing protein [Sphingomonas ginkgonis]